MRASSLVLGPRQPSRLAGVVVALLGVAAITALILPLRQVTPVVATGVLYLVVVLLVSVVWGVWLGLATSVVSALAFNYFHLPPTGRLTIAHTENVVALIVFFVAAVVASSLADLVRARTQQAELRRREADLTAELARLLQRRGSAWPRRSRCARPRSIWARRTRTRARPRSPWSRRTGA